MTESKHSRLSFVITILLGAGCINILVNPVSAQDGCISYPLPQEVVDKLVTAANVTISHNNRINCTAHGDSTGNIDSNVLATLSFMQCSLTATKDELSASKSEWSNAQREASSIQSSVSAKVDELTAGKREFENALNQIQSSVSAIRSELAELQRNYEIVTSKSAKCKNGWFLFQNSCYFFSTGTANFHDGRQHCRNLGSDYVKISTDAEYTFILSHVISNTWIGLNDIEIEGTYKWISDGTIYEINRAWWHDGQPDDAGGSEDCVHIWFTGGRKLLNDNNCAISVHFICEMMPETPIV